MTPHESRAVRLWGSIDRNEPPRWRAAAAEFSHIAMDRGLAGDLEGVRFFSSCAALARARARLIEHERYAAKGRRRQAKAAAIAVVAAAALTPLLDARADVPGLPGGMPQQVEQVGC